VDCGPVPGVEDSLEDCFVHFCRNDVYIAGLRGGLHVGTNNSRNRRRAQGKVHRLASMAAGPLSQAEAKV
jgi:hypothetical protein